MALTVRQLPPSEPGKPRRRWRKIVTLVVLAAAVGFAVSSFISANRVPGFPSLASAPDLSLHGTVAYGNYDSVHVSAMSGSGSKTLLSGVGHAGQPYIDEVLWLTDGRLQVTSHADSRYNHPAWRAIYDLTTGEAEQVPPDQIPASPNQPQPVTVNPEGQQLTSSSDHGHVKVVLSTPRVSQTLLEATGGRQYEIGTPMWSPDFKSVLLHDNADRILLITLNPRPVTRILAEHAAILWGTTKADFVILES